MFYGDKIKSIRENDRVLEIGPGASPFHRSDVFLEIKLDSDEEYAAQFGHDEKLKTDKPVVFYDGKKFPFKDNEFDYVICSHVLEHVDDVEGFLKEMFRVAPKGYLEYPLITYDYLFNFNVHLNFLKYNNGELKWMKKSETPLSAFRHQQDFLLQVMLKGHMTKMLNDLSSYFFEGFEYTGDFRISKANSIEEVYSYADLPDYKEPELSSAGVKKLGKEFVKSLLTKIKS